MAGLVKRCCYCRADLADNPRSASCDRCQKNESKYGKPTTCKTCNLPAAFREGKCVYCASSERKHGDPVSCANCKVKMAFTHKKDRPALCRLCQITARTKKLEILAGVKVPPEKPPSSGNATKKDTSAKEEREKEKKRKRHSDGVKDSGESSAKEAKRNFSDSENVMLIQQLRDQIAAQNAIIKEREDTIKENRMRIGALQAEIMTSERKYREKFDRMLKEKEEAINIIHEKYRQQAKEKRKEKEKDKEREKEKA